ncbi:MAG TPA: AI-2E family transporter [Patescibacteria group bacterium]|nr:AI-2E family transporter [Patescibacteria group bacterium]
MDNVEPPQSPHPSGPALSPREHRWLEAVLALGSISLFFIVVSQLATIWAIFSDLILTFFFAWLLGFILEPIASWLARFMPRVVAVAIAYGAVAIAALGLVVVAASALVVSTTEFLRGLPQFQRDLVALLEPVSEWLRTLGFGKVDVEAQIETILATLATQAEDLLEPLRIVAVAGVGFIGNLMIVFFLAVFISIDRPAIGSFLLRLVPPAYGSEAHLLTESVGRSFGGFIRGMVVIGGSYGLVALATSLVLGLPYAALTTTAAGVLMAIPFFGPLVSWAPPIIVAAVAKPDALVPALAIMGIGWFINQNILAPRVLAGAVGLHPVVVLASILVGLRFFGITGAVFGLPVAAVISSFFFYFLRRNAGPDERSVAARAARRLAERDGRPRRVLREPRPGEAEEIDDDAEPGGAPPSGAPPSGAPPGGAPPGGGAPGGTPRAEG